MEKLMLAVLFYGGIWGVFEATVGYLLHLLPFSIGWLVWYPIACFFMLQVYIKTKQVKSILLIGLLSCAIKLTNLMLPVRIDRVLNPAVSILFEAITMAAVVFCGGKSGRTFQTINSRSSFIRSLYEQRLAFPVYVVFAVFGTELDARHLRHKQSFVMAYLYRTSQSCYFSNPFHRFAFLSCSLKPDRKY